VKYYTNFRKSLWLPWAAIWIWYESTRRIKNFDKYKIKDVKPTLVIKGAWQEFYIKNGMAGARKPASATTKIETHIGTDSYW